MLQAVIFFFFKEAITIFLSSMFTLCTWLPTGILKKDYSTVETHLQSTYLWTPGNTTCTFCYDFGLLSVTVGLFSEALCWTLSIDKSGQRVKRGIFACFAYWQFFFSLPSPQSPIPFPPIPCKHWFVWNEPSWLDGRLKCSYILFVF